MISSFKEINEVTWRVCRPGLEKWIASWGLFTLEQLKAMLDEQLQKIADCAARALDDVYKVE